MFSDRTSNPNKEQLFLCYTHRRKLEEVEIRVKALFLLYSSYVAR